MGDDRNTGGLEQTVQLLDRVLFCRSFHSKLSPVGGLKPKSLSAGQDRRVAPIVPPETWPLDTQAIKDASADPETSLILLTENWSEAQPEFVSESAPLIVEIPARAAAKRSVALQERIERALGVHLTY